MTCKTRQTIKTILKAVFAVTVVFLLVLLVVDNSKQITGKLSVQLVLVEQSGPWTLCADKDTRVLYIMKDGRGITAVLNPDGTPRIWNGEIP